MKNHQFWNLSHTPSHIFKQFHSIFMYFCPILINFGQIMIYLLKIVLELRNSKVIIAHTFPQSTIFCVIWRLDLQTNWHSHRPKGTKQSKNYNIEFKIMIFLGKNIKYYQNGEYLSSNDIKWYVFPSSSKNILKCMLFIEFLPFFFTDQLRFKIWTPDQIKKNCVLVFVRWDFVVGSLPSICVIYQIKQNSILKLCI